MSMSDKIAAFLARSRRENRAADQASANTTTLTGLAASDSTNGAVAVIIPGADVIQPEDADGVQQGDNTVVVPIIGTAQKGDEITILGVGNGIADNPIVVGAAGSGDRVKEVAEEAQNAANAINQHFFDDDQGIHVTTGENDASTGPNLLANSIGVLLRNGTLVMSAQTPSGFTVYDGQGNGSSNVVATFGQNCVIGSIEGQHMLISEDEMTLLIPAWEPYETPTYVYKTAFHVGYVTDSVTGNRFPYYDLGERSTGYAIGQRSTIIGYGLIAGNSQIVLGHYNAQSNDVFVIGCGSDDNNRANILTVDSTGLLRCESVWLTGSIHATDTYTGTLQATGAITGASLTTTGDIKSTGGDISGDDISATGNLSVGGNSTVTGNETVTGTMAAGDLTKNSMSVLGYDVLYTNTSGSFSGDIVLSNRVIFSGGGNGYYKRVDIFYKDSDGHFGSVSMWNPDNLQKVSLATSSMWARGFSTKARTIEIVGGNTFRTLNAYYQSGVQHYWNGQFIIDGNGSRYEEGNYIGITSVIGYK